MVDLLLRCGSCKLALARAGGRGSFFQFFSIPAPVDEVLLWKIQTDRVLDHLDPNPPTPQPKMPHFADLLLLPLLRELGWEIVFHPPRKSPQLVPYLSADVGG